MSHARLNIPVRLHPSGALLVPGVCVQEPRKAPCVAPANAESSESAEPDETAHSPLRRGGRLQPLLPHPAADPPPRRRLVPATLLSVQLNEIYALKELSVIFGAQAELIQKLRIGSGLLDPFDHGVA